jgi:hypothetical protein
VSQHSVSISASLMADELSDHEIHKLSSRFNLQVREEAAYLLWYIWRTNRAKYAHLPACISALQDEKLYIAMKEAGTRGNYDAIRCWRGMDASRSCNRPAPELRAVTSC